MIEILSMILIALAIVGMLIISALLFEFIVEVPRQLKRIADALGKENE